MKLITFILMAMTLVSCIEKKQEESYPEIRPEQQQEEDFDRKRLDFQLEQDQRGRTSEVLMLDAKDEVEN